MDKKTFLFFSVGSEASFFDQNPDEVRAFHEKLKQNTRQNLQDIKTLVTQGAGLSPYDERYTIIFSYLSQLVYDFDGSVREGLLEFYQLSSELGLTPKVSKLEFIPERS